MPLTFSIDAARGIVHLVFTGNPTFDEWAQVMTEVLEHPDFRPGIGVISDRRGIPVPSADYVRSAIEFSHAHPALSSCLYALIVSDTASYGMARMGQILGDDLRAPIGIFRTPEEAEDWIVAHNRPRRVIADTADFTRR